jgi:hypothetical protein
MTPCEHQLIVEMFKQQTMLYAGLVELLKSREVIEKGAGDLEAFDALVAASLRQSLEENTEADYLRIAAILGVNVELPRIT